MFAVVMSLAIARWPGPEGPMERAQPVQCQEGKRFPQALLHIYIPPDPVSPTSGSEEHYKFVVAA